MDDGIRGALPAPFQHGSDVLVLALEYGFHPAVGEISDPAGEVERLGGFLGVCTEEDALYTAGNINMYALHQFQIILVAACPSD